MAEVGSPPLALVEWQ